MKMTVTSIELKDIRRFPDSVRIDFVDESGKPIKQSFIMMENGTGKTTTITLIKGLLDGSADNWDSEKVRSFKPTQWDANEGSLRLAVKFDDKVYIYVLKLDYNNGRASTYCTTAAHGGLGPRQFPLALNGLFTPDFVHRFVFDGEQAEKTMDNQSNEAEEAIKYLYRLDVFDEIIRNNRALLAAKQAKGSPGTKQSVKNLETRMARVSSTIERLENRAKEIHGIIAEKKGIQDDIEARIRKIDEKYKNLNEAKKKAESEVETAKNAIDLSVATILSKIKSPYLISPAICNRMFEFGDSMTKLKLPKTISKDFFIELSKQPTCICGRSIGIKESETIRVNADRYLGSDQQSVLNNIKSNLMNSRYDGSLDDGFEDLADQSVALKLAKDHLMDADDKLAAQGGSEAEKLRSDRDELRDEIAHLDAELQTIESKDESNPSLTEDNNIPKAKAAYDDLEVKIADATETNDALYRKEIVETLIERICERATETLKEEIIRKTNEKIKTVITDDTVEIESIDKYIQLKGKTGASAGQTLGIAYCFLGTLFEDAELLFPFIIDSPCGSMDFNKRYAVASILPKLFNQMIAFVMSAEVERFADQFYDQESSQFITIVANAQDGTVTIEKGKDFFDNYQREHRMEE